MTQRFERLAELMALDVQMLGKVALGRQLAAALLHLADSGNDVVEIRWFDLRLECAQNQISCLVGRRRLNVRLSYCDTKPDGNGTQPTQPIYICL